MVCYGQKQELVGQQIWDYWRVGETAVCLFYVNFGKCIPADIFYLHSLRTSETTLGKKKKKRPLWQSNIHKHRCGELIGRVGNCTFIYLWRITVSFWSLFVEHLEINHSCNYVPDQKTKLVNNIKEDYPWIYVSPKPWGTESGESCLLCSHFNSSEDI